jgi:hypothetical protein
MTPGRLLWLARNYFRHGVRGAYGRETIAPRVLGCAPLTGLTDARAEVHVLTSGQDWIALLWALRTFYRASGRRYRLCIHEDGTLPPAGAAELRRQFPDARLIDRGTADARLAVALAAAPACRAHRDKNPLLLKTFDFEAFLETESLVVLDSDLLFFQEPRALLARIEDLSDRRSSFNRDWRYGYSVPWDEIVARAAPPVETLINSGLGVLRRGVVSPAWCESYFATFPSLPRHPHRIEQTLIALCAARHGYVMLPAEYDVREGPTDFTLPVRHYSGFLRRRLYTEGLPHIWRHRRQLLDA